MKKPFSLAGILLISVMLYGQTPNNVSIKPTDWKDNSKNYTLSGYRHGVNFFPLVKLSQVQYEAGESLTFDRYHSAEVVYYWLEKWSENYPDLIDLYQVGESYEGRPIFQITLTNKKTGKDTDKPAAFFEGGRHSGEVTGTETVLWLIKYLLDNYDTDQTITHLIDSK
jgi:hypothetical protein